MLTSGSASSHSSMQVSQACPSMASSLTTRRHMPRILCHACSRRLLTPKQRAGLPLQPPPPPDWLKPDCSSCCQTFAVTVPRGVGPGQQFQASLDGQLTMVIVPRGSGPSSRLHVQIPMRPTNAQKYAVTIPAGVGRFQANLGGKLVWLSCPRSLGAGKQMFVDVSASLQQRAIPWPPPIGVPEELESTKIPDCFLCPIKGELMRQPAITPDGITYDYDGIVGWLQNKPTDPSTNHALSSRDLIPNRLLRTMMEDFISKGPDFLREK